MLTSMMRALVLALLSVTAARAAAQQGSASHPYQPGIDVADYDIRLDLPDTGAFLRGDVTVTAWRAAGVRTLRLDLVANLSNHEVAGTGGCVLYIVSHHICIGNN